MLKYALAVFLSAFLLFQVQPIVAKYLLPWFGGASSVWTVCLVFFQVFLLLGYLYAHLLCKIASIKHQTLIHVCLVGLAMLAFLPIEPSGAAVSGLTDNPQIEILLVLVLTIGLPYALISSSGPLFQSWFQHDFPSGATYRLYALSNTGSLLGLLSYPLLFEPFLDLKQQANLWSVGFLVYFAICLVCLWSAKRNLVPVSGANERLADHNADNTHESNLRPTLPTILLWIGLAATASVLLLATTNQITQDIASVPFLWILPLALYLISFIICFDKPTWYRRRFWVPLLIASSVAALIAIMKGSTASFWYQILAYTGMLFVGCMVCHGELYAKRPHPALLTKFYLTVSLGGALGGFFVALVAPLLFTGYWELHLVWVVLFVLVGLCLFANAKFKSRLMDLGAQVAWTLLCVVLSFMLYAHIENRKANVSEQTRGFYGVLTLSEHLFDEASSPEPRRIRLLKNGSIIHGSQLTLDGKPLFQPTSYYSEQSGVGLAIEYQLGKEHLPGPRVGVLGMGAATIASLCESCRTLTFFEIDPNVIDIEQRYFSNIAEARAAGVSVDVIEGDGRISLSGAVAGGEPFDFDVLAIDAFSGDAIPVHLLTYEAVELYWQNLSANGILAMHISNRHLDIAPVIIKIAKEMGKTVVKASNLDDQSRAVYASDWILMTDNQDFLNQLVSPQACNKGQVKDLPTWTDQYSNIVRIMSQPTIGNDSEHQRFTCY
ncbi:spermidine synthase [Arenicella xantha]|uniref:Spermidine synthase n=1 Tax=Arenicella xantha TaxID=644221 RepID=A0A395JKY7_9GAMM|nr:ferrichrome ABC transporter permease [Arenicella xantha]RBP51371.1 spermidine synthase [Arenicella xantha]